MNKDNIKTLVHEYFTGTLAVDEEIRREKSRIFTPDEPEGQHLGCSGTLDKIGEEITCVDLRRVSPQVLEYLDKKGITDIPPDSLKFKVLALELLKAQYSILQIITARTNGDNEKEEELKKEYLETVLGGVDVVSHKRDQGL